MTSVSRIAGQQCYVKMQRVVGDVWGHRKLREIKNDRYIERVREREVEPFSVVSLYDTFTLVG